MNTKDVHLSSSFPEFHLNMQVLVDSFSEKYHDLELIVQNDTPHLDGFRLFQPGKPLFTKYIYLIRSSDVNDILQNVQNISFLIIGRTDPEHFHPSCSLLQLGTEKDFVDILDITQQTFEKYKQWNRSLQSALLSTNPVDDMLEASLDIFKNPVFVHDKSFYILSCPRHVTGMSIWSRDSRTGREMVPLSLIQDFEIEGEYLRTLTTIGPDIYARDMRGYRILYRNLWVNGNYMGRICVNELQSLIKPSDFLVMDYLGTFLEICLRQNLLFTLYMGGNITDFFTNMLDRKNTDIKSIQSALLFFNWDPHDTYLVIRMENDQKSMQVHSSAATLGQIETQISASHAFLYEQGIVIVTNLSYNHLSVSDVISRLAIILREGLFKMGVSSEFTDFAFLHQGYEQAVTALRFGKKSGSMIWCYRFEDFMLEYIAEQSLSSLSTEMLCSQKLKALRKYDAENNTDFYHTLEVYLNLERNVLQTAKTLFIHRSTLFYRLERIQKITKANLDDPKERLLLLLSFYLLKHNSDS
ncbi:MAG: PucR family transcriptional regulator [Muricoprocola sp.]